MPFKSANPSMQPDKVLIDIADYVADYKIENPAAYEAARYCLIDALGCAILSLKFPECVSHLGPIVAGTRVPSGSRVPGTSFVLDPVQAAFDIGCMIRWLDYNDTWLAEEWGHPSDNFGGILAVMDYISRARVDRRIPPFTMRDVLTAAIKAYEIQGVLALANSFNKVGLDHVILVKLATAAVVAGLLGGTQRYIVNSLSNALIDGGPLRVYRQSPNTGSRKSWAAGDATSRGVRLALMTVNGEMGYPTALSTKQWGFETVFLNGQNLKLARPLGSYVIENILYKISYPAEFHAQTAVEATLHLYPQVKDKVDQISKIVIHTQEPAVRIIDKKGPLHNQADRDHCLQYMVAVALLYGNLKAQYYEDGVAENPRIDALRAKIEVVEDKQFSRDYLDPEKRSIANAVQIFFGDGSATEKITIEYPLGHHSRREEGTPKLVDKFKTNLNSHYDEDRTAEIVNLCLDPTRFELTGVNEFMQLLTY